MILESACYALKLECALRNLGFVEIGWKVITHYGLFFIFPEGAQPSCKPTDICIGFKVLKHLNAPLVDNPTRLAPTAKAAFSLAEHLSGLDS